MTQTTSQQGWVETTLGEVAEDIAYGYTHSATSEKIGPKFLRITDIQNDSINWKKVPYCPISQKDHQKYKLQIGDIVIARTGNSTGAMATIKKNVDAVFASYLIRFKINPKKADFYFIDFLLRSNMWKKFVKSIKSGSAQGGANAKNFASFPVLLPSLPEQRAIAAVLSSFDDKIELLRAQNRTLEAIAQKLFEEWFIKFNFPNREGKPYKKNGGKMVESELGEIPKGWRIRGIGDCVKIRGGTTPSTRNPDFWSGDIPWTSPKDLSNSKEVFLLQTEKMITREGLKQISSGLLPKGTLLLSSRAPIGYLAISNLEIAINQGYIAFLPNQYFSNHFMYLWLKINMQTVINAANGSTFLEISKSSFKNIQCVIPAQDVLKKFEQIVMPIFEKILFNLKQIQNFSTLREILLPQLMHGDVRVKTF